jgi:hypothetical protein
MAARQQPVQAKLAFCRNDADGDRKLPGEVGRTESAIQGLAKKLADEVPMISPTVTAPAGFHVMSRGLPGISLGADKTQNP